jgi:N-hydroxyarylamine O-acetyltransferase
MTPDDSFDLDGYFARIGYTGSRAVNLETLQALHRLHPQTIPFENLNPLLGLPVRLDIASLQQKLVRSRRGGYCFEHNLLFGRVLKELGFRVTGLAGRVLWNQPSDALPPRSHKVLRVELDGRTYLADVGFGQTPTGPLLFELEREQATPHEPYRLLQSGEQMTLQVKLGETWTTLYRFDLHEQHQIDYEVANHYVSTYPTSHFVNSLIAARATPEGRYGLRNNRLSMHRLDGTNERRELRSAAEIRAVLDELFGVVVPDAVRFDARVEALNLLAPA